MLKRATIFNSAKMFWAKNFFWLSAVWYCAESVFSMLNFEYLGENETKLENILTHWSVVQAGSNDEKNWGSKISLDCPFKSIYWCPLIYVHCFSVSALSPLSSRLSFPLYSIYILFSGFYLSEERRTIDGGSLAWKWYLERSPHSRRSEQL